jgi:hypothetical protein
MKVYPKLSSHITASGLGSCAIFEIYDTINKEITFICSYEDDFEHLWSYNKDNIIDILENNNISEE